MKKERKTVQVAAGEPPRKTLKLTWDQERFVDAYIKHNGVGLLAYQAIVPTMSKECAASMAYKWLSKVHILHAIEARREEIRQALSIKAEDVIQALSGMAEATLDDFTNVMRDPTNRKNYRGLRDKRKGLEFARQTTVYTEQGEKVTNEIKILSASERRAALNDLWEKLGLAKTANLDSRQDVLAEVQLDAEKLGRKETE